MSIFNRLNGYSKTVEAAPILELLDNYVKLTYYQYGTLNNAEYPLFFGSDTDTINIGIEIRLNEIESKIITILDTLLEIELITKKDMTQAGYSGYSLYVFDGENIYDYLLQHAGDGGNYSESDLENLRSGYEVIFYILNTNESIIPFFDWILAFGNPKVNVTEPDITLSSYLINTYYDTNSYIAGIEFISDDESGRYEWNKPIDDLRPFVYEGCDKLLKLIVPYAIEIPLDDVSFFLFGVGKMTSIDPTTLSELPNIEFPGIYIILNLYTDRTNCQYIFAHSDLIYDNNNDNNNILITGIGLFHNFGYAYAFSKIKNYDNNILTEYILEFNNAFTSSTLENCQIYFTEGFLRTTIPVLAPDFVSDCRYLEYVEIVGNAEYLEALAFIDRTALFANIGSYNDVNIIIYELGYEFFKDLDMVPYVFVSDSFDGSIDFRGSEPIGPLYINGEEVLGIATVLRENYSIEMSINGQPVILE